MGLPIPTSPMADLSKEDLPAIQNSIIQPQPLPLSSHHSQIHSTLLSHSLRRARNGISNPLPSHPNSTRIKKINDEMMTMISTPWDPKSGPACLKSVGSATWIEKTAAEPEKEKPIFPHQRYAIPSPKSPELEFLPLREGGNEERARTELPGEVHAAYEALKLHIAFEERVLRAEEERGQVRWKEASQQTQPMNPEPLPVQSDVCTQQPPPPPPPPPGPPPAEAFQNADAEIGGMDAETGPHTTVSPTFANLQLNKPAPPSGGERRESLPEDYAATTGGGRYDASRDPRRRGR
ncbi:hypothetical protein K469DRAFT_711568 [Zopfia rhizophila CBS 207.26]|uniref:Uncharacterized protein n=1 Tax=Zopfia rhizophila CBS 207.26 TaxID=1314779 RepID=A0A6A6DUY4_9PEZI|nr:hypothetical protein K469DRAFT_711568 [Zopfia rhizophila CBS 207.26]